jgi:eukaryotic-like serine/threonine-protein kinase
LTGSAPISDPFNASLAGRRLGRYEVLARLASGGMAGVYVARALGVAGFERLFAVKVLHPHLAHEQEFITMFLDEARLAARIRHPNVVPTIDISDTQDAGYYLVMDYIEGDHLGALLHHASKLGTRLPLPIALRIIVDALDGLHAAHDLIDEQGRRVNLVHRDVSPHNIMVGTDGIARITDFGVAKAEVRLSTTREGQFKGKLAYMAPEHASTGEADQRSDLFSLAIILWECLTGRRLFRAENQAATLNKICIEPIPPPSSVDPALAPFDSVLALGLARDPADRYQSAEEFAEAIEAHVAQSVGLANQRAVAKLVREYAAEKIVRDRELIRSAIADLDSMQADDASYELAQQVDEGAPLPFRAFDPGGSPSHAPTALPSLSTFEVRPRWPFWLLGTLALVAAGLALIALLLRGEQSSVTSYPLPPETPALNVSAGGNPARSVPLGAVQPEPPASSETAQGQQAEQERQDRVIDAPVTGQPGRNQPGGRPERRRSPGTPSGEGSSKEEPKPETNPDLLLNPYRSQ